MYQAEPDPYCYPGSTILKNKADLRDEGALEEFESAMTFARAAEPLPAGRFSVSHYRAIHRHLFQDVYSWAGRFRTVRLTKGRSTFCYPEHVAREISGCSRGSRTGASSKIAVPTSLPQVRRIALRS